MNYQQQLKNSGIKVTQHKLAILKLFEQNKHLDATTIVDLLHTQQVDISLATVYRVLSSFETHKIINKHNFGSEHASYELNSTEEHHDHLICLKCGSVIEFVNQEIERLQKEIAKENNFHLVHHTLNIYGNCSNCNEPTNNP